MGGDEEKWRRALLKKLRSAAGVKARIDAKDQSLQKSQLGKGTAKGIEDLTRQCVEAGLGRDGPEIRDALAKGADEGRAAMAAAKARGPDGPEGQRAERKRERAAALASLASTSGGGGGRDGASNGGDAKRPKRDDNAGTGGAGSKHAHGECKRATWALHALAKAPTDAASIANAAKALAHHKSIAGVDALLASVALWSAAKLRAGADGGAEWGADTAVRRELTRAASGVASRVSDLVNAFDARGASNALWALATLHSVPGGVDADAGHAATKALIKALNGTLKDACNARDAANALWGCAKMRCGLSPETVKVLSVAVCIDTSDVGEASMALWAIASMRSDGTLAHGPARAAAVHVASSLSDKVGKWEKGKVDARVTANASWAASKLIEVGDASDSTASDALQAVLEGLVRRFVSAASEAGPAFQLEYPRAAAQLVAAHLALGGGASAVIPLINQGLKSCVTKGRKEMEKEAKQRAQQNGTGDATVRVQKPTDDDLAALCEAAERCGPSAEIEKNWLRSAVNAACTARVGDPAALGWRAAGRLEHCVFSVLNIGPASAQLDKGRCDRDDVAVVERLLRSGAAAAKSADAGRLATENGAAECLLNTAKDGPCSGGSVDASKGGSGDARVLCVDDTHRLLSFGLRERGWSVTNWNRFTRRDRRGAPWPPAVRLPFDAATIRLPPTKAAFAMAATAVAARVKPGGIVWVYGADREGVRGCASDLPNGLFERCVVVNTENPPSAGSSSDGSPHGIPVEDSIGGFAALRCMRTDRDPSADVAADDASGFKSRSNLRLELQGNNPHDVDGWVTYPGLFAGGGLDVMTDFLLQTMTASKTCALGGGGGGNGGDEVLSALDFCSGSGTLAAAVRFVRPHARLTLMDADAVAMLAARENLSVVRDGSSSSSGSFQPATFVLSDGWTGLADDEKFDLVVSNPPVHLGLRPEFTVLSDMIAGFEHRLNPGGEAWFVAQRYVPIAGICAELGGLAASVTCAGVNEKFAAWTVRKPGGDASLLEAKTPKKDKKEKKEKKEKSAKKMKKEKKEKSAKKEKR